MTSTRKELIEHLKLVAVKARKLRRHNLWSGQDEDGLVELLPEHLEQASYALETRSHLGELFDREYRSFLQFYSGSSHAESLAAAASMEALCASGEFARTFRNLCHTLVEEERRRIAAESALATLQDAKRPRPLCGAEGFVNGYSVKCKFPPHGPDDDHEDGPITWPVLGTE